MYYTYAYLREDKTPYYIGRGKHHSGYKYHRMTQKHTCGIPPQERRLILKDNLSKEQAIKHEEYMIDLFGLVWDETGVLRNHVRDSRGGSCKGRKLSEETKQKISAAYEETEVEEAKLYAAKGTAYPATIDTLRKIVKDKQHQTVMFKSGQAIVELFKANAMVQVYDALKKPEMKKTFEKMSFLFKIVIGVIMYIKSVRR